MKSPDKSKLETLLNLAVIIVAMTFTASLIAHYVKRNPETTRRPPIEIGSKLDLPELELGATDETLLLVLSTTCSYCAKSSPFYRRLVKEVEQNEKLRLTALFPQDTSAGRQYLRDNGVLIDDVRQISPAALGVSGVPSLILTDRHGVVQNLWIGKLGPHLESLVISRLKGESNPALAGSIDSTRLQEALTRKEPVVVLNIDDREIYQQEHIDGAINIPFDELETRIENELKPSDRIVIYESVPAGYAHEAFEILKSNGFQNVSVLQGGFRSWKDQHSRSR